MCRGGICGGGSIGAQGVRRLDRSAVDLGVIVGLTEVPRFPSHCVVTMFLTLSQGNFVLYPHHRFHIWHVSVNKSSTTLLSPSPSSSVFGVECCRLLKSF